MSQNERSTVTTRGHTVASSPLGGTPSQDNQSLAQAAVDLSRRGFHVVALCSPVFDEDGNVTGCSEPAHRKHGKACTSPGKRPVAPNGHGTGWNKVWTEHSDPRSDEALDIVRSWWHRWPNANVGIATGLEGSRIIVIDIDGPQGRASLASLQAQHDTLPPTLTSRSGRADGGQHLFFKVPDTQDISKLTNRSGSVLGLGIDVRASGGGGQVVCPPSVHASGRRYSWQSDCEPATLPQWLYKLLTEEPKERAQRGASPKQIVRSQGHTRPYALAALEDECRDIESAPPGTRGGTIFKAACQLFELVAGGELEEAIVVSSIRAAAAVCDADPYDIERGIERGRLKGLQNPRRAPVRHLAIARGNKPSGQAKPAPQSPPPTPLTISEVRKRITDTLTRTDAEHDAVLGRFQVGAGKTTLTTQLARQWADASSVRVIVAHTRQAAVRYMRSIDREQGTALFVGRSLAGTLPEPHWRPSFIAGTTPNDFNLSNCGNTNIGPNGPDCGDCPFKSACNASHQDSWGSVSAPGYLASKQKVKQLLRKGGVIICTPQMLRPLLELCDREVKEPALWQHIAFDDVSKPPAKSTLTPEKLRTAAEHIDPDKHPLAHQLVVGLAHVLEQFAHDTDPGPYGTHLSISQTRTLLASWLGTREIQTGSPLQKALATKHVPYLLSDLVAWLAGERRGASAFIVRNPNSNGTDSGSELEFYSEPPKLPRCAATVLSATATPTAWQAWLGRQLHINAPYVRPQDTTGVRIQSAMWDPITWQRETKHGITPAHLARATSQGRHLRDSLHDKKRLLVIAHLSVLSTADFGVTLEALLSASQFKGEHTVIHWRGVDQVGSDAFNGFDACLMLGTPVAHFGAWKRWAYAVAQWADPTGGERWQQAYEQALSEREVEAAGLVEQGGGRPRFLLEHNGGVLIHIAGLRDGQLQSGLTLQALCPSITDAHLTPGPRDSLPLFERWLKQHQWTAWGAVLADLPQDLRPPLSAQTLRRKATEQPERNRWLVTLSGRGRPSVWVGEQRQDIETAALRYLRLSGERSLISIEPMTRPVPDNPNAYKRPHHEAAMLHHDEVFRAVSKTGSQLSQTRVSEPVGGGEAKSGSEADCDGHVFRSNSCIKHKRQGLERKTSAVSSQVEVRRPKTGSTPRLHQVQCSPSALRVPVAVMASVAVAMGFAALLSAVPEEVVPRATNVRAKQICRPDGAGLGIESALDHVQYGCRRRLNRCRPRSNLPHIDLRPI